MSTFLNYIKNFDIFAFNFNFTNGKRLSYKSLISSILSILLILTFLTLTFILISNWVVISKYRVNITRPTDSKIPIRFNKNLSDKNTNDMFFKINLSLYNKNIFDYFYIEINGIKAQRCSLTNENIISSIDLEPYSISACLINDEYYLNDLKINVFPCFNEKNPNKDICLNKEIESNENINIILINGYLSYDYKLGYYYNNIPAKLEDSLKLMMDLKISKNEILSLNENIFINRNNMNIKTSFPTVESESITYDDKNSDLLMELNILSGSFYDEIIISTKSVRTLFAFIFGLLILFIIGNIFVYAFNNFKFTIKTIYSMFDVITNEDIAEINENSDIDKYIKKKKDNNENLGEIITSINKTKIESEIALDFYKYGKNLDEEKVSSKNLSIIFYFLINLLKKMFLCCKSKEKKNEGREMANDGEGKNYYELIFHTFNKIAESRNISLLVKEARLLKTISLNNYKNIPDLNKLVLDLSIDEVKVNNEQNIKFKNINKINNFIDGLRILKNKIVLNQKDEINMIKMLFEMESNFNKNKSKQYFQRYFSNHIANVQRNNE